MATATPTRTRRTAEEWDALARELLPELQSGGSLAKLLRERGSTNVYAIQAALGRMGYDSKGREIKIREITAKSDKTLAKRIAERREKGAPWWELEIATGKSYAELHKLLETHGHAAVASGRVAKTASTNGDATEA